MPGIALASTDGLTDGHRADISPPSPNRSTQQVNLAPLKLWQGLVTVVMLVGLASCQPPTAPSARALNIQQNWELKPGDKIGDRLVTGSLGDISIDLGGARLYAPFAGEVEPAGEAHCVIYSTAEIPAYLFRLCGLRRPRFGPVRAGQSMGTGQYLQFATLRRQPDGTWIIVEPAKGILERAIDPDAPAMPSATSETEVQPGS